MKELKLPYGCAPEEMRETIYFLIDGVRSDIYSVNKYTRRSTFFFHKERWTVRDLANRLKRLTIHHRANLVGDASDIVLAFGYNHIRYNVDTNLFDNNVFDSDGACYLFEYTLNELVSLMNVLIPLVYE